MPFWDIGGLADQPKRHHWTLLWSNLCITVTDARELAGSLLMLERSCLWPTVLRHRREEQGDDRRNGDRHVEFDEKIGAEDSAEHPIAC